LSGDFLAGGFLDPAFSGFSGASIFEGSAFSEVEVSGVTGFGGVVSGLGLRGGTVTAPIFTFA
jgi:hypothetical protein